jgi:hypothetical protein
VRKEKNIFEKKLSDLMEMFHHGILTEGEGSVQLSSSLM